MSTTAQDAAESAWEPSAPIFSRCSVGKKWFWVSWRDFEAICEQMPYSSGYAASSHEAEEQARASIKAGISHESPNRFQNQFASGVHRRQVLKRRASRASSKDTGVNEIKYLYSDYDSDYDGAWHSIRHQVVKETSKRVFVELQSDAWTDGNGQIYCEVRTFVLDRNELETNGCAYSRRRREFFYTTPAEQRHKRGRPGCLEVLGLDVGATDEAIGRAYRSLAMKFHPDHGGSNEEFKTLHHAYEEAMALRA